jgi:hypothetical protein
LKPGALKDDNNYIIGKYEVPITNYGKDEGLRTKDEGQITNY